MIPVHHKRVCTLLCVASCSVCSSASFFSFVGYISRDRLNGILGVTRAFGDIAFKEYPPPPPDGDMWRGQQLISKPETRSVRCYCCDLFCSRRWTVAGKRRKGTGIRYKQQFSSVPSAIWLQVQELPIQPAHVPLLLTTSPRPLPLPRLFLFGGILHKELARYSSFSRGMLGPWSNDYSAPQ